MHVEFATEPWHDFFVMLGGAAAVLLGLLTVVYILRIEASGTAWLRYGPRSSLGLLVLALTVSAIGLVPDQPRSLTGTETALAGAVALVLWLLDMKAVVSQNHGIPARVRQWGPGRLVGLVASVVGGISVAAGHGGGWYIEAPALLILVTSSIQSTWWALSGHQPAAKPDPT